VQRGKGVGVQIVSTEDCIEAIAHYRAAQGHSPNTARLDAWILRAIGVPPQQATLMDLERVVMRNKNKGSRSTYCARLRSCFVALRKLGLIDNTADEGLPQLRAPQTLPRPLTDDQVTRLLANLKGPHLDIFRLGILAGTRSMEVCAMKGSDLSEGVHGPELLLHGKGGKEETVPAHPRVVEIIESYETLGRLFTRWGTPLALSHAMGTSMRRALGGEDVHYHQCRHTFGTRLLTASGHDVLLTSRLLRHANLNTTLIYVKVADDRPRFAVNALAG
jgi:integrase